MAKIKIEEMREKMFESGGYDEYAPSGEHPPKKTIRDDIESSLIKTRYPIRNVQIEDIIMDSPGQTRQITLDPQKYEEDASLIESIHLNGIVVPVMVQVLDDDSEDIMASTKYRMVYGHRRVAAARYLGIGTVLASVAPKEVDVNLVTYIENVGIRSLTSYEQGLFFKKYIEEHEMSQVTFAEKTGLNRSFVTLVMRAIKAVQACPKLEELFKSGLSALSIIHLRDIFDAVSLESHNELADLVSSLRSSEIQNLYKLTKDGINPLSYLRAKCSSDDETRNDFSENDCAEEDSVHSEMKEQVNDEETGTANYNSLFLWEELENNENTISTYSATYSLPDAEVKNLIMCCRETSAPPDCLQPLLLFKKNGGEVTPDVVVEMGALLSSKGIRNLIIRQVSAYERFEKQCRVSKDACAQLANSLHPQSVDILNIVFGFTEETNNG